MRRYTLFVAVGLFLSTALSAHAATVTLNPGVSVGLIEARARDRGTNMDTVLDTGMPETVPSMGTYIATDGFGERASSTVDYSFGDAGLTTTIDLVLPNFGGAFVGFFQETYFSLSDAAAFDLSGSFSSLHSAPGRTTLDIMLRDVTSGSVIFRNQQRSLDTQSESFIVGGSGGDWINVVQGSTSGNLLAGREYALIQFAFLNNAPLDSTSATATGAFSIVFTPVPEPGTALLLGFGLALLAALRVPNRLHLNFVD